MFRKKEARYTLFKEPPLYMIERVFEHDVFFALLSDRVLVWEPKLCPGGPDPINFLLLTAATTNAPTNAIAITRTSSTTTSTTTSIAITNRLPRSLPRLLPLLLLLLPVILSSVIAVTITVVIALAKTSATRVYSYYCFSPINKH